MARGTQTGRQMVRVMNVRLTPEQDAAVERRAKERDVSASVALRELLDLGISLARAGTAGTVMTEGARQLLSDGFASRLVHLTLRPGEDDELVDELARVLDLGWTERNVVAAGGLLWLSAEERRSLSGGLLP